MLTTVSSPDDAGTDDRWTPARHAQDEAPDTAEAPPTPADRAALGEPRPVDLPQRGAPVPPPPAPSTHPRPAVGEPEQRFAPPLNDDDAATWTTAPYSTSNRPASGNHAASDNAPQTRLPGWNQPAAPGASTNDAPTAQPWEQSPSSQAWEQGHGWGHGREQTPGERPAPRAAVAHPEVEQTQIFDREVVRRELARTQGQDGTQVPTEGRWQDAHGVAAPRRQWDAGQQYSAAPPAHAGTAAHTPAYGAASGYGGTLADGFRQEEFSTAPTPEPQSGWRRAVLKGTFGLVNPGESRSEREDRERAERVRANIRGQFIFAVICPRGGVAKTTTTAALGSMFASLRGSEVLALDANPDEGNLASRINPQATATFADLLRDAKNIRGVTDTRSYTANNVDKLDVLASSKELVRPATYTPSQLVDTVNVLRSSYRIIGIDSGNRLHSEVFSTTLDLVSAVVVVAGCQVDSGYSALRFYDWMIANGRGDLVDRSFLLISDRSPASSPKIRASIEERVSSTKWANPLYVPFDEHLNEAGVINLAQLRRPTYRAYLEGAARLADFYGMPPIPAQAQR